MKNSLHPINPIKDYNTHKGTLGLTKLEYFAVKIMQGLVSNVDSDKYSLGDGKTTNSAENKAKFCIIMADELLKQLSLHTGGQAL